MPRESIVMAVDEVVGKPEGAVPVGEVLLKEIPLLLIPLESRLTSFWRT